MKKSSQHSFHKIGLISTPWPLFNRPSIQLGTLKAFLNDKILKFLKMMVDKKLMFEENNKYLSLAVPLK